MNLAKQRQLAGHKPAPMPHNTSNCGRCVVRVVRGRDLPVKAEGSALVKVFVTPAGGLADVSITQVELAPGTATPDHIHDRDQVVFVLQGKGRFVGEGEEEVLGAGDLIYLRAGRTHRHESVGTIPLKQLSIFVMPREVGE
jgi:quercetin dioxygenase-like cupin family protein